MVRDSHSERVDLILLLDKIFQCLLNTLVNNILPLLFLNVLSKIKVTVTFYTV